MGDEAFHAAEALGQREQPDAVEQPARGLERAQVERKHAAEALHLTPASACCGCVGSPG
jgi:hypothetical protein